MEGDDFEIDYSDEERERKYDLYSLGFRYREGHPLARQNEVRRSSPTERNEEIESKVNVDSPCTSMTDFFPDFQSSETTRLTIQESEQSTRSASECSRDTVLAQVLSQWDSRDDRLRKRTPSKRKEELVCFRVRKKSIEDKEIKLYSGTLSISNNDEDSNNVNGDYADSQKDNVNKYDNCQNKNSGNNDCNKINKNKLNDDNEIGKNVTNVNVSNTNSNQNAQTEPIPETFLINQYLAVLNVQDGFSLCKLLEGYDGMHTNKVSVEWLEPKVKINRRCNYTKYYEVGKKDRILLEKTILCEVSIEREKRTNLIKLSREDYYNVITSLKISLELKKKREQAILEKARQKQIRLEKAGQEEKKLAEPEIAKPYK